jgi:DNA-binding protein HU-beta
MSKAFIASVIQDSAAIPAIHAYRVAGDLMAAIEQEIKKSGRFSLPTFGTFSVRRIKAGKAINPRTGERIKVKARKTVRFKASPKLRRKV